MPEKQGYMKYISLKNIVIILIIIAALSAIGYLYYTNQQTQQELDQIKEDPQALLQQETEDLLTEIGSVVDLPEGEIPTVATVQDATKLKEQAFFSTAENGDKVLIYTEAKKAFLYRPSTKKIIEIAPVTLGDVEEEKTDTSSENP